MRGKDLKAVSGGGSTGITPAYAGKSGRQQPDDACAGDHPRVCGEKTKKIP